MNDEIELKLAVAPEHVERLKRHPILRALKETRGTTKRLVSTYYDTPALELLHKAVALRVRKIGQQRIQTIKREPKAGKSLIARQEWEKHIDGDRPDISMVEDPELRSLIETHANEGELKPVFVTDVTRQVWPIRMGTSRIECALDVGEIKAEGKTAPVCEVELGLVSGTPSKLFELARKLNKTIPLRLEHTSKAERGYNLLTGVTPAPKRAAAVHLESEMTVRSAFAAIARGCVMHILDNVESAHHGEDPEGLHQLRVGIRRLRAAFSVFREAIPETDREAIGGQLRRLQQELGPAREWDVFIDSTMRIVAKRLHSAKGLDVLLDAAEGERRRGYERARTALTDPLCTDLLLHLEAWLDGMLTNGINFTNGHKHEGEDTLNGVLDRPILAFATEVLRARHAKVLKLGARGRKISDDEIHELRIRVKKLRYAIEFFRDLYNDKSIKRFTTTLRGLQEVLGTAHDALVADDLIPRLETIADVGAERAIGQLQGWCAAQIKHDRKRLDALWGNFARLRPFWK
ncbi:MAG TPA: CHAD domain-containing protein [Alphaproteobacteria bacterium]|nr:CHAD domain-containing protein [Alphaproteobacteria bacterium]